MDKQDLDSLTQQAEAEVAASDSVSSLDDIRVAYLGKKGSITALLKSLGKLSAEDRPAAGAAINVAKQAVQSAIEAKKTELETLQLAERLKSEKIDVTLPGRGEKPGSLHPVTVTIERISQYFSQIGFTVAKGPEI